MIATIGVATPVVIAFATGDRSAELLDSLKAWMSHNSSVIMAVILLMIGVKLLGDGIAGLWSEPLTAPFAGGERAEPRGGRGSS